MFSEKFLNPDYSGLSVQKSVFGLFLQKGSNNLPNFCMIVEGQLGASFELEGVSEKNI